MINWIRQWFDKGTGQIARTALHWTFVALHGIAGIIHTIFGNVNGAWAELTHALWSAMDAVRNGIRYAYHGLWWIIRKGLPGLLTWAVKEFDRVWHWFTVITARMTCDILNALHLAEHYATSLWQWAYRHVIAPIEHSLSSAWNWIRNRGETVWFYITHPGKLADLILPELAGAIVRASDKVLTDLGIILFALLLRNIKRVLHIIEDVIVAVL